MVTHVRLSIAQTLSSCDLAREEPVWVIFDGLYFSTLVFNYDVIEIVATFFFICLANWIFFSHPTTNPLTGGNI